MENLTNYTLKEINVVSDEQVKGKWKGTFINLGSSSSNIKTDDIKHHQNNTLFQDDRGSIKLKNGKIFKFPDDGRHDVGIIFKMKNPHFKGYSLIVCAGLGEWGTSGAAWFLAHHWKKLSFKFLDNDFVVIISVLRGSDESAQIIYESDTWWIKLLPRKIRFWKKSNENLIIK